MDIAPILYRVNDYVATLTINREAKRNSLTVEAVQLLLDYLEQAEAEPEVRVLVLTGAGERAFCAGADLESAFESSDHFALFAQFFKRLTSFSKPTLARVNGYCLAAGMGLMLACDLVIARDDATFATPEVNVGVFPMIIGALIFRNLHRKHGFEMTMLGQQFTAHQALEMGMINRAVPADTFEAEVGAVVRQLVAKSPIALRLGKEAFYTASDMPFEEAIDYLTQKLVKVQATEDAQEGVKAFIEKRKPNFKGQ